MKVVQNNSYWRDLLDNTPQLLFVFKIDEQEKTELVFVNNQSENVIGYLPEEYVLQGSQNSSVKKDLDTLVDKLAQHSREEISDKDCIVELTSKNGQKTSFNFIYEAFKIKSSQYFHINVLLSTKELLKSKHENLGLNTNSTLIVESMVMKALVERIPTIIENQQAIIIQGESKTGKTTVLNYITNHPELAGWYICNGIEQLNQNDLSTKTKIVVKLDQLDLLESKDQKVLYQFIDSALQKGVELKLIGTTSISMDKLLENGRFLPELYYKLVAYTLHLPSLRFRKEDVETYLNEKKKALQIILNKPNLNYSLECVSFFKSTDWKSNFESVQEFVESMLSYIDGDRIELPDEFRLEDGDQSSLFDESISDLISFDKMQANYLRDVLKRTNGKIYGKGGAAQILKLKPTTLQSKLKKLGVK